MESAPHLEDSDIGEANSPETPLPEMQKTCLRNSPCMQQGCLSCCTPHNHVRDLSDALDDVTLAATITKSTANSSTIVRANSKPKPPPDHVIVSLTETFLDAIQENDIFDLECTMKLYAHAFSSNVEFTTYDTSAPPASKPSKSWTPAPPPLLCRSLRPPPSLILRQFSLPPPVLSLPN